MKMRTIFLACILFFITASSKELKGEERDDDLREIKVFLILTKCTIYVAFDRSILIDFVIDCRVF